jgi:hypothetical protein
MTASNQIFLVMDVGSPVAAFTGRRELKAFLQRRREAFTNPLVYTFWHSRPVNHDHIDRAGRWMNNANHPRDRDRSTRPLS